MVSNITSLSTSAPKSNMKLYVIEAEIYDLPLEMLNKNGFSKNIKDVKSAVLEKKYEFDCSGMSGCPVFNIENGDENIIGIMNGGITATIGNYPFKGITFTEASKIFE